MTTAASDLPVKSYTHCQLVPSQLVYAHRIFQIVWNLQSIVVFGTELQVSRRLLCASLWSFWSLWHLRSASHQLSVPRGCHIAGPRVWNSVPDHQWDPAVDSKQFRGDLKTYLFAGHSKHQRSRGVNSAVQIDIYFTYLKRRIKFIYTMVWIQVDLVRVDSGYSMTDKR